MTNAMKKALEARARAVFCWLNGHDAERVDTNLMGVRVMSERGITICAFDHGGISMRHDGELVKLSGSMINHLVASHPIPDVKATRMELEISLHMMLDARAAAVYEWHFNRAPSVIGGSSDRVWATSSNGDCCIEVNKSGKVTLKVLERVSDITAEPSVALICANHPLPGSKLTESSVG